LTLLAGESGGTTRMSGVMATWVTATKSFIGSNDRFLLRWPITVCPLEVRTSV
jgi:hypothetical protein